MEFVAELAGGPRRPRRAALNGVIGPRGDGYVVGHHDVRRPRRPRYHALQARAFADAGADMVTAVTMTYADEAIGVARAASQRRAARR